MTLQNKYIKYIAPLVCILVLLFGSALSVYASSDTTTLTNLIHSNQYNTFKYKAIVTDGSNYYYCTSTDNMHLTRKYLYGPISSSWGYYISMGGDYAVYKIPVNTSTVTRVQTGKVENYNYHLYGMKNYTSALDDTVRALILASNCDLYLVTDMTSNGGTITYTNEVFFCATVSPLQSVAMTITPKQVLGQTVGLVPLLMLFLVGLVAFWKGWQFLCKRLHKA